MKKTIAILTASMAAVAVYAAVSISWNNYPIGTPAANDTFLLGSMTNNYRLSWNALTNFMATNFPSGGSGAVSDYVTYDKGNVTFTVLTDNGTNPGSLLRYDAGNN